MKLFTTADGREIEYLEVGDPGGQPVVHLHGTPGTGGGVVLLQEAAARSGVRLVGVSRPGYGGSTTTAPGLLPVGADIGELARAIGIDEFAALGTSGGGPFALAAAAALPERIHTVLVAAGPGPMHLLAPEHLEPDDERALELLAAGDVDTAVALVTAEAQRDFDPMRQLSSEEFAEALAGVAPPSEHYFDTRPEDRAIFTADFRRAIQRYDGFVRDNLSWLGSWDFELDAVVAPVHLFYGDADLMVPAVNGEWLAERLPRASLTIVPAAGHGEITFGLGEQMFAVLKQSSGAEPPRS
jgi:pimeloyl-ACP methyl ester carboxylesterase